MSSRIGSFIVLFALPALSALSHGCSSGAPLEEVGAYCDRAEECQSGVCDSMRSFGTCVRPCTSDTDCQDAPALTGTCDADGFCQHTCSIPDRTFFEGVVCLDGGERSCSTLDDSYCDVCEDKCPGQRCIAGEGCAPLSDVGEPCGQDRDCRTANCSLYLGVCRVPLETACDETNCDLCISNDAGWSYCSRECGTGFDAPECGTGRCVGRLNYNDFHCRPACNDACPGICQTTTDGDIRYCVERSSTDWTISTAPRPVLASCWGDSHCADGLCLSAPSCDSRGYDCLGRRGYCTAGCTSDAQCGDGGRCVEVACPAGETERCGFVCLPGCDPTDYEACRDLADADCNELPSIAGGTQAVCDPRNGQGEYCVSDRHCASNDCSSSNRCSAAGGAPNGSSCGVTSDCASGNCQAGTCRGTALRGDPCGNDFDCSVGTCTSMGICD